MARVDAPLSALPGLLAALGVLAGTAVGSHGPEGVCAVAVAASAGCLLPRALPVRPAAFGALLGLCVAARAPPTDDDLSRRLPPTPVRVRVEGTVRATEPPAPDGWRFVLDASRWEHGGGGGAGRARLRVFVAADAATPGPPLPGDRVAVLGGASPIRPATNPGEHDARASWARRGVHARLTVADPRAVEVVARGDGPFAALAALRNRASARLSATLAPADGGLLRSLLLGDRGALDPADRERFREAGAAHILAISGAHVALLLAGLLAALRRLGMPARVAIPGVLVVAFLYVPLSGSAAPVVRATVGSTLFLVGRLAGREPGSGLLLAAVAAGFLTVDPSAWRDPGFRLSFAAAAGMVLLTGPLRRALVPRSVVVLAADRGRRAPLRTALAAATAAWLGSLPVALHDLGQLSWVAVPVGLVAVPLSTVLMLEGIAGLALAGVPVAGDAVRAAIEGTAWALRGFLDLPALLGLETVHPAPPPVAWYAAFGAALVVVARSRGARGALAGTAAAALLALLPGEAERRPPGSVRVTLLDVGHGQAAIVEAPDGATALVDAGSLHRPEPGERIVLPALRALGVARLDVAVASHEDADHVGALAEVLRSVPARALAHPAAFPPALRDALARGGATPVAVAAGDVVLRGAWGALRVVAPARGPTLLDENDGCLVLALEAAGCRVLLPADREEAGVAELLATAAGLDVDVVVLPHHGHPGPGLDRLLARHPGAIRVASAPPSVVPRLPPGTWSTGAHGALVVDLEPSGPRVSARFPPDRREPSRYDPPPSRPPPMDDPLALLAAGLALVALAAASTRLAWLTPAGALGAVALGFLSVLAFGWPGLAALLAPFLVATLLGKLPGGPADGGPRSLRQVGANGLPALVGAGLALAGHRGVGLPAFLGCLAALGADTVATEVGTRFGGTPRSAVTWRPLPAGASGGVTAAGTLASVAGAFLAPLAFAATGALGVRPLLAIAAAGFAGGVLDSLLGAALQRKGRCPACGAGVESRTHCGAPVPLARGRLAFLDNDAVNLVNAVASSALAPALVLF